MGGLAKSMIFIPVVSVCPPLPPVPPPTTVCYSLVD